MNPLIPIIIGQGISDLANTAYTHWNNKENRRFNAEEAQKSRDFQQEMAQNQYQWAVDDMKKAGLNPAMMYASGGNGNTAPSGASAAATGSSSQARSLEILGAYGKIMNEINDARGLDLKAKELGMKNEQNSMTRRTSTQIYNRLGKIVRQVVSTTN